jgi:hypothetical protein
MFYIIGTEDTFVRHCNKPKPLSSQPWHDYVNQSIQDAALLESEAYKSLNQPESSSSS